MTKATIYHNPSCSKSRNTMAILEENNVDINEVRYLDNPPTKQELAKLCSLMKVSPLDIIRTGEDLFKELGLSKATAKSDDEWLAVMIDNPKLIERPIVRIGDKVVIGRPPENILNIL